MPFKTLLSAANFSPYSLEPPDGWVGHMPFAAWLMRVLNPSIFVELGTHSGNSYFSFCQSVQENNLQTCCYSIDLWEGDEHAGYYGSEVFASVQRYNAERYDAFSRLLRMSFDEAATYFKDGSIELLHIDGLHTYEAVKHDFETWFEKLAPGAIVLFHDTNVRERGFGVWRYWNELQERFSHSLELFHSNGLGVIQLDGAQPGKTLDALFPCNLESTILREYFSALGARQLDRFALRQCRTLVEQLGLQLSRAIEESAARGMEVSRLGGVVGELERSLADRNMETSRLTSVVGVQDRKLTEQRAKIEALQAEVQGFLKSKSWRVTRPLRLLVHCFRRGCSGMRGATRRRFLSFSRAVYWKMPSFLRPLVQSAIYNVCGFLFSGTGNFERWRAEKNRVSCRCSTAQSGLVSLADVRPLGGALHARIAIHAHVFYSDLAGEFAAQFSHMPFDYDLYVSVTDDSSMAVCREVFSRLPLLRKLSVVKVPNKGRDVAPFVCTFGEQLLRYEYVCHVHSKKSQYTQGRTDGWREYLLSSLFGSKERIQKIFALLTDQQGAIGMFYPQTFKAVPYMAHTWLANRENGVAWCRRLGVEPPQGYFDFPAGSMFWARVDAIRPLLESGISLDDFPDEKGQNDGTLAHCIERLFGLLPRQQGYNLAIARDDMCPSWSSWRLDQGLCRSWQHLVAQVTDLQIKVVIFDVFDTLLLRPFLDPEDIKKVVSRRIGGDHGRCYLAERQRVEEAARGKAGRDIGLQEIYAEWATMRTIPQDVLEVMRTLEEEVEIASVCVRQQVFSLLSMAREAGKRVVLASDMYLPLAVVETMLAKNGLSGWDEFYLSNQVGLRKDRGELYNFLLGKEGVAVDQVLVVGDNERSDIQIPGDMGIAFCHVLRPVEIARGMPRWRRLVENQKLVGSLDASAGLGLILRHCFDKMIYPDLAVEALVNSAKDVGFAVVGPICLAFCTWLARTAKSDGIEKVYFLSREGAILKRVYDCWAEGKAHCPASEYLILSRRSVNVPAISDFESVMEIAKVDYAPNSLDMFLRERFGLEMHEALWDELCAQGLWERGRAVEITGRQVGSLVPVLRHLFPRISTAAAREREALLLYLGAMGLTSKDRCAVVDVGYSGTVQGGLNRLLDNPIGGYYLVANQTAKDMGEAFGAVVRGCFVDGPDHGSSRLSSDSFTLEKLLSSNEDQILYYEQPPNRGGGKDVLPVYRKEKDLLPQTAELRSEVQAGIMAFVSEAARLRDDLLPDFEFPVWLGEELFSLFVSDSSEVEQAIVQDIVLDDYYCGRGLVRNEFP